MKNSKFLKIDMADVKKAIILGAGVLTGGEAVAPVIDQVSTAIGEAPAQPTHANSIVYAIVTVLVYLAKNWLSNSKGELAKKEPETAL